MAEDIIPSTLTQEVSNLALHIVREMYGEQVERVCKVLLRNGPSTIVDIIAHLGENVDHNKLCKILCILVQQNLLHVCLKEDKATGIYEFDTTAAINNIRVPQMLEHVHLHYGGGREGKDAETIVNKLLINGRLSETLIIEEALAVIRKEEQLDENKPEHSARIDHRRVQLRELLQILSKDGYVVRIDTLSVKKRVLKLPKGVNLKIFGAPEKEEEPQSAKMLAPPPMDPPKKKSTSAKKKKKKKRPRDEEDMDGMNAVYAAVSKKKKKVKKKKKSKKKLKSPTAKRVKLDTGKSKKTASPARAEASAAAQAATSSSQSRSPQVTAAPATPAQANVADRSAVALHSEFNYRVSYAPFLNTKRRDVCITYVGKLKGPRARLLVATMFELVEEQGKLGDRSAGGVALNYSRVISAVQDAAKRNAAMEPLTVEQVVAELSMLEKPPLGCVHTFESAGRQTIAFHSSHIVDCVKDSTVEQVIRQKHKIRALRLYNILKQAKYLDETELGKRAMMPLKKARECLFMLFCDKFVQCQEISQTSERAPKSTYFCWALNRSSSLYPHLKSILCKIALNVRLRRAHELETNQSLFDRKNNDLCATEEEVAKAGAVYGKLNRLDVTLIKLDEMMMTLFDF